jgi:hypothetical protein
MSDLRIDDKDLVREKKGIIFSCKNKIKKTLEDGEHIYLLFFLRDKKPNNALCIDQSGNIVWQIDESALLGKTIFANIYEKDGKLFVTTWSGFTCEINKKTGRVISKIFTK